MRDKQVTTILFNAIQGATMFREEPGTAALRFTIDEISGERIQAWQQQLNQEIIRRQIARSGRAIVIRFRDQHGLQQLTEVPRPGEAEPWYGEIGGMYTYTFKPELRGCDVQVDMTDRGTAGADSLRVATSLNLRTSAALELVTNVQQVQQPRWRRPEIWGAGTSLHELSGAQPRFWIDADIYRRLVVLGWSWQQARTFRYRFTPLTVGCDIVVQHVPSGHALHLTRHIN